MFRHIMVPVDLAEKDKLDTAIRVAVEQAGFYGARITFVSVCGGLSAKVSHNPQRYAARLAEFAAPIAAAHGVEIDTRIYDVPDPSVEVDAKLLEAIGDLGADLAVMGTHQPGWIEYIINSHGGRLAAHAPISVLVVRDPPDT